MTKKTKRSKAKYPALKKELNLKSREDYIEPTYVDGIKDEKGNTIIRPLTDKEKQYLNDFYSETIITDFLHHPELKRLHNKKKSLINNNFINSLKDELKKLRADKGDPERINELKKIIKLTREQNMEMYQDKIQEIDREMQKVREEVLLYPDKEDHKQFYGANNARNNCLLNKLKSMKQIIHIEPEYDNMFCSIENNLFNSIDGDYEEKLIQELERNRYEEEEERLQEIMKEEKLKK